MEEEDWKSDGVYEAEEEKAWEDLEAAIALIVSGLDYTWHTGGDENGSGVLRSMREAVLAAGHAWPTREDGENPVGPKMGYQKKPIPRSLRTAVFERDMYRCKICEGYKSLTADHIFPESKGGLATMDNLQTLCRSCNSRKGNR